MTGWKTERWVTGPQQILINYQQSAVEKATVKIQTCGTDKTFIVQLQ